jgi:predicted AAA+ superfamily ATPase
LEASEELKAEKLTIVTWDEKRETEKDGRIIQLRPLWEWLFESDHDNKEKDK